MLFHLLTICFGDGKLVWMDQKKEVAKLQNMVSIESIQQLLAAVEEEECW